MSHENSRALFLNRTLKKSPERSHTQGLIDLSSQITQKQGVQVEHLRPIDYEIATGCGSDMTEHGGERDAWPSIHQWLTAADILVIAAVDLAG
ncbi:hypothetical protein AB0F11_23055 [Streptomyces sp. NPDC032472]|uniref:hypothetical protein n=1 Tax=Streptomyces sp. NPDC032472 TaxID=3155018 RepID=UPI0033C924CB